MAALIYPKDTMKSLKNFTGDSKEDFELKSQEVQKIHQILYKFTHEKMHAFFNWPPLKTLFQTFINLEQGRIPKSLNKQMAAMLSLT